MDRVAYLPFVSLWCMRCTLRHFAVFCASGAALEPSEGVALSNSWLDMFLKTQISFATAAALRVPPLGSMPAAPGPNRPL